MHIPPEIMLLLSSLEDAGFPAYLAGGCVRDALRGIRPKDYDIASAARPRDAAACFPSLRIIETGLKHGTITVVSGDFHVEVTTFRVDGKYHDARRPESIAFASRIEDDLARRDFTINAMAYSPVRGLVDFYNGQSDLKSGVIRCVGEPKLRFGEDALRIMRGLRFASVLSFAIDSNTLSAMRKNAHHLRRVSIERTAKELLQLICGSGVEAVLSEYSDILDAGVEPLRGVMRDYIPRAVGYADSEPVARLAALFSALTPEAAVTRLGELKLDNKTCHDVRVMLENAALPPEDARSLRLTLGKIGLGALCASLSLAGAIARAKGDCEAPSTFDALRREAPMMHQTGACCAIRDLAIRGGDLLELGLRPGPEVAKVLYRLLEAVIDGECVNEAGALREYAAGEISKK